MGGADCHRHCRVNFRRVVERRNVILGNRQTATDRLLKCEMARKDVAAPRLVLKLADDRLALSLGQRALHAQE